MTDVLLVPRPQHLEERSGTAPADCPFVEEQDGGLPAQGYELEIGPGGVHVRFADEDGRRYARGLLEQIRSQSSGLPFLLVRDWPDFPVRGYMLDVSRDRVPTRETLARLVEVMSLARINQFQVYTEHTFAYRDHEVVWQDASPITPDDIAWLETLCSDAGIELVANQNCFGHMNRWLKHDAYKSRAECPDGGRAPWGAELPPFTLAPTPDNAAFVLELFDELLPNFSSRRVNIGGDEPFDLGQGQSADDVARRGKTVVYLEHMERIVRPLVERGHEVQIWGDILREDLALAEKTLPQGVVALPWGYEAPWSDEQWQQIPESLREVLLRLEQDPRLGFRAQLEPLAGTDIPFWVAPGTASWNSLIGRVDTAVGNLVDASEAGTEFGAGGYLITDWGDNGHHQPPSVSFGPLLYGGAVSWSLRANRDLDLPAALDTFVFDDSSHTLGGSIDRLGQMWRETGQMAFNSSPIFTALTRGAAPIGAADLDRCRAAVEEIDELIATVQRSAPLCADASAVPHELVTAARLARHGIWRIMRKSGESAPNDETLRSDLSDAIAEQRAAWLARARPGGLDDSLERLESTLAQY